MPAAAFLICHLRGGLAQEVTGCRPSRQKSHRQKTKDDFDGRESTARCASADFSCISQVCRSSKRGTNGKRSCEGLHPRGLVRSCVGAGVASPASSRCATCKIAADLRTARTASIEPGASSNACLLNNVAASRSCCAEREPISHATAAAGPRRPTRQWQRTLIA